MEINTALTSENRLTLGGWFRVALSVTGLSEVKKVLRGNGLTNLIISN